MPEFTHNRAGKKAQAVGSTVAGGRAPRVRLLSWLRPEQVGPPDCPIMFRWTLLGSSGARHRLMLHWFPPHSDDRDVHDHPCDFTTLVLQGGYDDLVPLEPELNVFAAGHFRAAWPKDWAVTEAGDVLSVGDRMRRGALRFRSAEHTHRTRVGSGGCWSLVWMRPARRRWGFFRHGRWFEWFKYEELFGFGMRCDPTPQESRVAAEVARKVAQSEWPGIEDPRKTVDPAYGLADPVVRRADADTLRKHRQALHGE